MAIGETFRQTTMKLFLIALFVALLAFGSPASAQARQPGTLYLNVKGATIGNVTTIENVFPGEETSGQTLNSVTAQILPGWANFFTLYPGIGRAGYLSIPEAQFSNYAFLLFAQPNCAGPAYLSAVQLPAHAWTTTINGSQTGTANVTAWLPQPPFQVLHILSFYGPTTIPIPSAPSCRNVDDIGLAGLLGSVNLTLPGPQDGSQIVSLNWN